MISPDFKLLQSGTQKYNSLLPGPNGALKLIFVIMFDNKEPEYENMKRDFEDFWPFLMQDIEENLKGVTDVAPISRLLTVLEENVPDGKKSRYD